MMVSSSTETVPAADILGEAEVRAWLKKESLASLVEEWIYWNNSPLRHVPVESLISFFPEKLYHSFLGEPRVRVLCDTILKKRLSWDAPVGWAPHDFLWNIGMITPVRFKRFLFLGTASIFSKEIARIIDGSLIRRLREELGEDIIQFVLLSGSSTKYVLEPMKEELLRTIPAAFEEGDNMIKLFQQGSVMLAEHAFSAKEQGIQKRIASKLPGCFAQGCVTSPLAWVKEAEEFLQRLWNETSSWI